MGNKRLLIFSIKLTSLIRIRYQKEKKASFAEGLARTVLDIGMDQEGG